MPLVIPFPDIDPAIFTLSLGGFQFSLRWYALAYLAALGLGWWIVRWLMGQPHRWPGNRAPMTQEQPGDLLTWMVLGVILGGRLGFVIFYNPAYYLENPAQIPQIWQGGMAFHGGMLGVIAAAWLFCRVNKLPAAEVGDAIALATPLGLFFGRLANFINGELWGRPTDVPWAMVFPTVPPAFWVDGVNVPRHPSQLYEAALEGLLLLVLMWWLALGRGWLKRPGAMIGVFLIGYGSARAFVENFRQWDPQLGYVVEWGSGGLTMGQLLSLPMIVVGGAVLAWALRRSPSPA